MQQTNSFHDNFISECLKHQQLQFALLVQPKPTTLHPIMGTFLARYVSSV